MPERIVISVRPKGDGIAFVVHEQPEAWFDGPIRRERGFRRHAKLRLRYENCFGGCEYLVVTCYIPQVGDGMCFMASRHDQLGREGMDFEDHPHWRQTRVARRVVTALLNVARRRGYDFAIVP